MRTSKIAVIRKMNNKKTSGIDDMRSITSVITKLLCSVGCGVSISFDDIAKLSNVKWLPTEPRSPSNFGKSCVNLFTDERFMLKSKFIKTHIKFVEWADSRAGNPTNLSVLRILADISLRDVLFSGLDGPPLDIALKLPVILDCPLQPLWHSEWRDVNLQ